MSSNFATYFEYLDSLKGKSWAEICWEEEEREEEEARLAEELRLKQLDLERKELFKIGNYEPEEGEIFE
jgi:hypothetical protein